MSDAAEVRALIAEARNRASEWGHIENAPGDVRLLSDLADALEAARRPATDDEREALADLIRDSGEYVSGSHAHDEINPYRAADCILAAGFRRSSRVPVSRGELAAFIAQWMADDHNGFGSCNAPRDMAGDILATHDIFPKADRKTADSETGDDRG